MIVTASRSGTSRKSVKHAANELLVALTTRGSRRAPDSILTFTSQFDSDPAHVRYLAGFVFEAWNRMQKLPPTRFNGELLFDLAKKGAAMEGVSRHVLTALDYLSMWSEARHYFVENRLWRATSHEFLSEGNHLRELSTAIAHRGSELSTTYGPVMLKAMITSFRDRSAAAALFRSAVNDYPEFAAAQPLDQFVSTYLTRKEVDANSDEISKRRRTLLETFEMQSELARGAADPTALFAFSCDPIFFAAFFPYWLSSIEYLKEHDVSLHFILVGERQATAEAIDRGVKLASAVSLLRGVDPAILSSRLSFSTVGVPNYVQNRRTYFACARYLLVRELAAQFERPVLLLDIDMMLRDDPGEFLRKLRTMPTGKLPVIKTRGSKMIVPGRRYLAGRFFFSGSDLDHEALGLVEGYVYAGLGMSRSWTLDQNALTYAVEMLTERHDIDTVVDIESFGYPFVQIPIRHLMRSVQQERSVN